MTRAGRQSTFNKHVHLILSVVADDSCLFAEGSSAIVVLPDMDSTRGRRRLSETIESKVLNDRVKV